MKARDVIPKLLDAVPEFGADYRELQEAFGDLEDGYVGEHVVFGRLFTFAHRHCRSLLTHESGEARSGSILRRVFTFLEEAACSGEREVKGFVAVSFLEYLWSVTPEERAYITSSLGPATLEILRHLESS